MSDSHCTWLEDWSWSEDEHINAARLNLSKVFTTNLSNGSFFRRIMLRHAEL